jgi:CDGSH-type Zn-finger protein
MAHIEVAGKPEHPKHVVTLEPGERLSLCRCYASAKFPICDGAHKLIPDLKGPVVVEAPLPAGHGPESTA